nr:MAG TPA: hypothetical protein [Caudoviricetes sp.]
MYLWYFDIWIHGIHPSYPYHGIARSRGLFIVALRAP